MEKGKVKNYYIKNLKCKSCEFNFPIRFKLEQRKYELIDIFEDQKILLNKKSITIRFTLVSDNHTLSSEEINDDLERLIGEFERNGYIVKR